MMELFEWVLPPDLVECFISEDLRAQMEDGDISAIWSRPGRDPSPAPGGRPPFTLDFTSRHLFRETGENSGSRFPVRHENSSFFPPAPALSTPPSKFLPTFAIPLCTHLQTIFHFKTEFRVHGELRFNYPLWRKIIIEPDLSTVNDHGVADE